MKRLCFHVELTSDTVVTRSSGTAGGHESLSYLPGAMFLGALARTLYRKSEPMTWRIFHSGAVRFLPAYPLGIDGRPAFPTPLSFYREKDVKDQFIWDSGDASGRMLNGGAKLVNRTATASRLLQPTRVGPEYLDAGGSRVDVRRAITPKTATINGTAYDAHLFAYQSIMAGTTFGLCIEIDEDDALSVEIETTLRQAILNTPIRLGRSRTAEFGSAICREAPAMLSRPAFDPIDSDHVIFYCHSDLLLIHPHTGQPTLSPLAQHFGLPKDSAFSADQSFVGTRRYSPFNGYRRRPDPERQVITQGSVIVFKLPAGCMLETAELEEIERHLARGIGAHRESGLGQVWLQPSFLMASPPRFSGTGSAPSGATNAAGEGSASAVQPAAPQDELVGWLSRQHDDQAGMRESARLARAWAEEIVKHIPRSGGVTRSQWAMIRIEAMQARSVSALLDRLFGLRPAPDESHDGDGKGERREGGLLDKGVRGNKWRRSFRGDSPRDCLLRLIEQHAPAEGRPGATGAGADATALRAVQVLALRMPRVMGEQNLGERA